MKTSRKREEQDEFIGIFEKMIFKQKICYLWKCEEFVS